MVISTIIEQTLYLEKSSANDVSQSSSPQSKRLKSPAQNESAGNWVVWHGPLQVTKSKRSGAT